MNGYARFTVRMSRGVIESVVRTSPITPHAVTHAAAAAADGDGGADSTADADAAAAAEAGDAAAGAGDRDVHVIDGTNKMLLPGMVNAYTHSIEAWGRGGIVPLPLELWVNSLFTHMDPRGPNPSISPDVVYWAALHTAVETILTGGTAVMDHLLQSRSRYPDGGCVKLLKDIGWLSLPGTSCAHCVWLEDDEQAIMAECGAVAVHNPVSNLRLGSGVAPIRAYLDKGITVAIGCDGQCSNDSQDMLEAMKMACIVNPLTTPEYRHWLSPREVLKMAAEGGAAAVGMRGQAGQIKPGYMADAVLVDLTALSMLPRADPVGQLVLTRQSSGIAGNTVHSVWVNGRLLLSDGVPTTVDLAPLREALMKQQPQYMDPKITDVKGRPIEVEYRAAMGLDAPLGKHNQSHTSNYPNFRVNYPADIPKS
ncbi:unnamed protein product [Closterium sp. Yama58-4]|nr:unnamed protein product [Closterium sp. Yama58-4]